MTRNTKVRAAIIIILLAVAACIVVGIMALAGAFTSSKTEAMELLLQTGDKFFKSSTSDYVGGREIADTFLESGGSVDMKCSNVQLDTSAQGSLTGNALLGIIDWSDFVLELNTQYDMDSGRTSNSVAVSKDDDRISAIICTDEDEEWVSLPELLDGKVFHVTDEEREQFGGESHAPKEVLTLFSELKSYVISDIASIQENITCEKIAKRNLESKGDKGYMLLIPQDTVNSFLSGFSDILKENENENICTFGGTMAEWSVSQDIQIKVYGEKDSLSEIELSVPVGGETYEAALVFDEENDTSCAVLTLSGNISDVPMTLTLKHTDKQADEYETAEDITLVSDGKQIIHADWQETVTPGSDTYKLKGNVDADGENKFLIEANGTIKDLKQGVCASYILDDVSISVDGSAVAAMELELSVSSRESSLEPPQGEMIELTADTTEEEMEQYTEELQSKLGEILSKMGLSNLLLLGGLA